MAQLQTCPSRYRHPMPPDRLRHPGFSHRMEIWSRPSVSKNLAIQFFILKRAAAPPPREAQPTPHLLDSKVDGTYHSITLCGHSRAGFALVISVRFSNKAGRRFARASHRIALSRWGPESMKFLSRVVW